PAINPWKQNPDPFFSSKLQFSEVVQAFPSVNARNGTKRNPTPVVYTCTAKIKAELRSFVRE
ncbi:MAG: hypothetical protein KAV87_06485, partial [Desulfobacteraceae bacterium]|nr:hypothetical protein [Desulfobacteraceae bacterium]